MDFGIEGRIALVTGADSGIGRATVAALLAEGCIVVATAPEQGHLDEVITEFGAPADRLRGWAADVRSSDSVQTLRDQVHREVGQIDILVQSAGVTGAQGPFDEILEEGWQQTLDVDLMGPVRVLQAFLPDLRRGWGRLVMLASEDAVQPYDDELPYCAAKAGILALTKGLSRSYAHEGLLANTVSPAFIATPMTDAMMDQRAAERGTDRNEAIASFLAEERPFMELGRRGEAEEVAAVIAFLCSEQASFVNGSNYRVDAGSVATI